MADKNKGSRKEKKSGGRIFWWIFRRIILPLVIVCALLGAGYYTLQKFNARKVEKLHATLYSQVQQVAELTVLKNNYTDVVSIKATKIGGLAKAYSIVKYRGVTRIGIEDVTKIKIEFGEDGNSAKVKVPFSTFLGNDIVPESLEVFDEKKSIFVPIGTQEIFDEIKIDMEENVARLKAEGILLEADSQVRSLITSMFHAAGIENVEVLNTF